MPKRTNVVDALARWRIVATGTVQLVNYRERVQRAAVAHHIVGDVEYDRRDDEKVWIDAQGAPADLQEFMAAIRGPEGRSDAREVARAKTLETDRSILRFQIKRGKTRQETLERVELARHTITGLADETVTFRGELRGQFDALESAVRDLSKSLAAVSNSASDREQAEQKAFASLADDVEKGVASLAKSLESAVGSLSEKDQGTQTALEALTESVDRKLGDVVQRLDTLAEEVERVEKETAARLEQLEGGNAVLAKSLDGISKLLEQEAEEQEAQTRTAEQQRAALLQLAGQLSAPGATRSRRRRSLR